jgi:hypothetical protein
LRIFCWDQESVTFLRGSGSFLMRNGILETTDLGAPGAQYYLAGLTSRTFHYAELGIFFFLKKTHIKSSYVLNKTYSYKTFT